MVALVAIDIAPWHVAKIISLPRPRQGEIRLTAINYRPILRPMKARKHPLRLWLANHGKTLQEFASELEVSQSYLSECVTGLKRPSLNFVDKIKEATDGEITAEHF